jgi:hypothetical protein
MITRKELYRLQEEFEVFGREYLKGNDLQNARRPLPEGTAFPSASEVSED